MTKVQTVVTQLQEKAPDTLTRLKYILRAQGGAEGQWLATAIEEDLAASQAGDEEPADEPELQPTA